MELTSAEKEWVSSRKSSTEPEHPQHPQSKTIRSMSEEETRVFLEGRVQHGVPLIDEHGVWVTRETNVPRQHKTALFLSKRAFKMVPLGVDADAQHQTIEKCAKFVFADSSEAEFRHLPFHKGVRFLPSTNEMVTPKVGSTGAGAAANGQEQKRVPSPFKFVFQEDSETLGPEKKDLVVLFTFLNDRRGLDVLEVARWRNVA
jgi:hypothetical protein